MIKYLNQYKVAKFKLNTNLVNINNTFLFSAQLLPLVLKNIFWIQSVFKRIYGLWGWDVVGNY